MSTVQVISFGYLHHPGAPDAHLTLDVRAHFRDPHVRPEMRQMTGQDPAVIAAVLGTPGVPGLIEAAAGAARAFLAGPAGVPLTVAVGCAGGRHRSVVIAARLAALLEGAGIPVALTHRDIRLAVVERPRPEAAR